MLPCNVALAIYMMTARDSAPAFSPTSESGDTTEPAMEEQSVSASPAPADPSTAAPAPASEGTAPGGDPGSAVATGTDTGSVSPSPPPEAWGEIMSFLDRPQQARQSALASLPTSDLIRLTLEASATALGRLGWYEGTSVSVSGGEPLRNPPPGRLLLRAAPVVKEPPPRASAPAPSPSAAEASDTAADETSARPPAVDAVSPVAVPKTCPLPYPGGSSGPASSGAGPVPERSSGDPVPAQEASQTTRPKSSPDAPPPVNRPPPESAPEDADDSLWEPAWHNQLCPRSLAPDTYTWVDVRPPLPPLLRSPPWSSREGWCINVRIPTTPGTIARPQWWPYPDLFCLAPAEHPTWLEQQEPAEPLSHLRLRGFCTHPCSRLVRREQGNRCLGICLRPIMAGERAGHTQHVCIHCLTGR